MARTLVLDIETVGESWEKLDETTQGVLTRWIDRSITDPEALAAARKDLKEGLGFSPLTGKVVAIGIYDLERFRGAVYYEGGVGVPDISYDSFVLKSASEKEMLARFWEGAASYDTFVTFNGRGFDIPFLNLRSAIHGIRPTQDLMDGRYLYQQKTVRHIDLQDQLTFYGAMHRRPSLHLFCRAFGIESPKEEGVAGDDVALLYREGQHETIAKYNARDVMATSELYTRWCQTLAPKGYQA